MRATSLKTKSFKRTGNGNRESTVESGTNQHNPAKVTRNRVPPPQRERILQKHVAGKSITDISKEEHRNRETITKSVRGPEMQSLVREMRERFFGLALDAISAVEHALVEQKDGRLAFQLLSSIGVIPSPAEKELLTAPQVTESDEEARVQKWVAALMKIAAEWMHAFGMRAPELDEELKKVGARIDYDTGKIVALDSEE